MLIRDQTSLEKIYLHIGMSKAGSSAIQRALAINSKLLERNDICFPASGQWEGAHHQVTIEIKENHTTKKLNQVINEAADYREAIISSEGFWLFKEDNIKLLKEVLANFDTEVILYLRRPSEYLPSSFRQGIKRTNEIHSCENYLADIKLEGRMNYPDLLNRWEKYFNLRVRTYESVKYFIEKDFFSILNIPKSKVCVDRIIINPTPPDCALKLMLMINKRFPKWSIRYIRGVVLKYGKLFKFLSGFDDTNLRDYGRAIVEQWDTAILSKYLPEEDLKQLIHNT